MSDWTEKRGELERKMLEARKTILDYEKTLKPYRTVTDTEYRHAKRDLIDAATAIHEGDHEANKPADPLEGMSLAQLKELYEQEKSAYVGDGPKIGEEGFTYKSGDTQKHVYLMKLQTRIQRLESEEGISE